MTLKEKIKEIKKSSTLNCLPIYPDIGKAKDLDELWEKAIKHNLPDKNIVIQWHKVLKDYIEKESNITLSIRRFGSHSKKEDSSVLRRGFLNKVIVNGNESFNTFFVDNGFTAYFYSLAKDGYAPVDWREFKDLIDNFEFPCGYFQTNKEKELAAYHKGKDPGISIKGYKIAHIFSAGENYSENAGYLKIADFCNTVFPRGDRSEWEANILTNGKHHRPIYLDDESEAKKIKDFAIAHFIRTVHPINYFLVPNKTNTKDESSGLIKTNIYWHDYDDGGKEKNEIGEYSKLIEYVATKIKDIYKDTNVYQEFLDMIFPTGNCIYPKGKNVQIDAQYSIGIWKEKIGNISAETKQNTKINSIVNSTISNTPSSVTNNFADFEKFAGLDGISSPSGYSTNIRKIMKELGITSLDKLNNDINGAIDYCTKKMNNVVTKKEKKGYSDCRSALKKYKKYLESTELYIECRKSWSSFRPLDRHCTGYCIKNDIITVYYGLGFSSDKPVSKKISPNDMGELIAILDKAITNNVLKKSNTTINTVHGALSTYEYSYKGQSAWNCGSLFDNSTIGETLSKRYNDLINKLTT